MRKTLRTLLATALPTLLLLPAAVAQQSGEVLTNDDIATMTEAGVPASIIVSKIEMTASDFDMSVGGLVALSKAGVDEAVLAAMTKGGAVGRQVMDIGPLLPSRFARRFLARLAEVPPLRLPRLVHHRFP